ncbi:MAG TPA: hypothetical protein VFS58_09300 [Steroidobacteraceae bacterium]|nr:hypothetical protein [Steroidobacteraceae bacterium]
MNENQWLSRLLGTGAVLETPVGLGLLVVPSPLAYLLLGAPLSGAGLVVARLAGGALLALGIACWVARSAPTSRAGLGVATAFMLYNIVACITLIPALTNPGSQALLLGAVVLHGLLAFGLLGTLVAHARQHGL